MKDLIILKMKKLFKNRFFILYILFAFLGVIIFSRLFSLQIINGEANAQLANRKMLSISQQSAARGGIYDRKGVPIATVRTSFQVKISKVNATYAERQTGYLRLVNILESNCENYSRKLSNYIKIEPYDFGDEIRDKPEALERWKEDMLGKEDTDGKLATPELTFNWLRNDKFSIDESYTDEEALRIMTVLYDILISGYTYMNPFASDISRRTVGEIEENRLEMPGVSVEEKPVRRYYDADAAAHIIGFVGPIDQNEYKTLKDDGYGWNDWIGKDGIEWYAEKWLKGKDGYRSIEADIFGRNDSIYFKNSVPGSDIMLTIDMDLQKTADRALKEQIAVIRDNIVDPANMKDAYAGAVVVLDVKTGEILAMASYPDFDPALYLDRSDSSTAAIINNWMQDTFNAPLINRAISGMYAPGSTFKLVTAAAAMDTGNLNPYDIYHDPGSVIVDGLPFSCVGGTSHGSINLEMAIAYSCNSYFHEAGLKTGIDAIDEYAKLFGLGEKTGVELPGEIAGVRANPETKKQNWNDIWRPADTAQVSIGQFSQAFTPIQMASYVAAIGNDGVRCHPHIIKDIVNSDGTRPDNFQPATGKADIGVSADAMSQIRKGMLTGTYLSYTYTDVVFSGLPVKVAVKTGTAETGEEAQGHSSNGIFICLAPAEKPEIAISVIIQRGVWGAYCAPVAAEIIKEYVSNTQPQNESLKIRGDIPVLIP